MLSEPDLPSALRRVTSVATEVVQHCDGASLTMRADGVPAAAAADGEWSLALDELQYREQEGPCLDCLREGSVSRVRDLGDDQRFPVYGRKAAALGGRAVMSLPLAARRRARAATFWSSTVTDGYYRRMNFLLWIIAAIIAVVGIVKLLSGAIILGIVLLVVACLVGPGGYSIFKGRGARV
ncbi:MAG: uncharacterized protein JWN77_252 [Frankiales bacterium]|jgi:hypothetical protein|nr:uncharacterized protein [Frankiales bacterium]